MWAHHGQNLQLWRWDREGADGAVSSNGREQTAMEGKRAGWEVSCPPQLFCIRPVLKCQASIALLPAWMSLQSYLSQVLSWDKISLCSPDWTRTHYFPASVSQGPGLQGCTAMAGLWMVFQYILCWMVHRIKQRAEEQHLKNYSELLTDKAKGLKSKAKLTTTTMEFVSERWSVAGEAWLTQGTGCTS